MTGGPSDEFEVEPTEEASGPSRDALRRMYRPTREVKVEGTRVLVPSKSPEPMEVRLSRYLDSDDRRELFLVCQDNDLVDIPPAERPWMLLIYPHAMESERAVKVLVDLLSQPNALGSRDKAWVVVRACEHAAGLEREEWVEAKVLESAETTKFLAERKDKLRQLQAADEGKAIAQLPPKRGETPPRKAGKNKRRRGE